jgi:endoglucanase
MALSAIGLFCSACGSSRSAAERSRMVHANGSTLIDGGGHEVRLRAVALSSTERGSAVDRIDLTEDDYQRAAEMGFGSVRLDFDPLSSTADAASRSDFFLWLDQQLIWAKRHDLLLVLAGSRGTRSAPSACQTDAFWELGESQDHWLSAWQAIAERYHEEPAVAGYDLLREPAPSADLQQWQTLANRTAGAIREVDPDHLLIFEQAQFVACVSVNLRPVESLATLGDPNVLYAFEARGPTAFTMQSSSRSAIVDGGSYPDELELGTIDWKRMTFESSDFTVAPPLNSEESEWTEKKHYYSAIKPSIVIAQVNLRSAKNRGTVYFDDLIVEELGPSFDFVRTVVDADLEDASSWFLWQDPNVEGTGVKGVSAGGHHGKAITLSGTTSEANLNNDPPFIFPVQQNSTYRVTGWMKGEHSDPTAESMIGLSLFSYQGEVPLRNQANLAATMQPFVAWGREHGVPLFVSAFGTSAATFQGEKGGLRWVSDMLDVLDQEALSFCYDAYQGPEFGIYPEPGAPNQPLVDLFAERLPHPARRLP